YSCREDSASQIDLAPLFARAGNVKIGTGQGRASQSSEDVAGLGRLAGNGRFHGRANLLRFRPFLGQAARERADQLTIGVERHDLEAREAAPCQTRAIILNRSLLCGIAHRQPLFYIWIYSPKNSCWQARLVRQDGNLSSFAPSPTRHAAKLAPQPTPVVHIVRRPPRRTKETHP